MRRVSHTISYSTPTIASPHLSSFFIPLKLNPTQLTSPSSRGTSVEFAQKVSSDDESHDVEMVEACQECRIAVVRKREAMADAKHDIRMMTSIWVFSDDNTVRLELKLVDGEMYVPYSSYFSPEKVSVTVPCELKFHDVRYGQRVQRSAKTNWINYIFESAHSTSPVPLQLPPPHPLAQTQNLTSPPPQAPHSSKTNSWAAPSSPHTVPPKPSASTKASPRPSPTPSKCAAWKTCASGRTPTPSPSSR